jgi:hypothetical protein
MINDLASWQVARDSSAMQPLRNGEDFRHGGADLQLDRSGDLSSRTVFDGRLVRGCFTQMSGSSALRADLGEKAGIG